MPECGTQVVICDLPVRFDTYKGCTHNCSYCFARKKQDIANVSRDESVIALKSFIDGYRSKTVSWADWDIPIHWGGMSDPFQPAERQLKYSLECLELLADRYYPFLFSTKSTLVAEEPYYSLLSRCNVVAQFSMLSPLYDKVESNAPKYHERLNILEKIAMVTKRVIIRVQPYALGLLDETLEAIKKYKDAGVFGIVVEGMKRQKKKEGFVRVGGDWAYPVEALRKDFTLIRDACHQSGLAFYSGENRLRFMGDDPCCCGVVGVPGFVPNTSNMNHLDAEGNITYRPGMEKPGTGRTFRSYVQRTDLARWVDQASYKENMEIAKNTNTFLEVMGMK